MIRYPFLLSADLIHSQKTIYAWHIADYHLFNVRSYIEFISITGCITTRSSSTRVSLKKIRSIDMPYPHASRATKMVENVTSRNTGSTRTPTLPQDNLGVWDLEV